MIPWDSNPPRDCLPAPRI